MATITRTERHVRTVEATLAASPNLTATRRQVERALAAEGTLTGRHGATFVETTAVVSAMLAYGVITADVTPTTEWTYTLQVTGDYRGRFAAAVERAEWGEDDPADYCPTALPA